MAERVAKPNRRFPERHFLSFKSFFLFFFLAFFVFMCWYVRDFIWNWALGTTYNPLKTLLAALVGATAVFLWVYVDERRPRAAPVLLRSGEVREYRLVKGIRYGSLIAIPFAFFGLLWFMQHSWFFSDFPVVGVVLVGVSLYLVLGPLVIYSQLYILSDAGIISQNFFFRRQVQWPDIQRVTQDRYNLWTGGGPMIGIYKSWKWWSFPAIRISGWVQDSEQLYTVIFERSLSLKWDEKQREQQKLSEEEST